MFKDRCRPEGPIEATDRRRLRPEAANGQRAIRLWHPAWMFTFRTCSDGGGSERSPRRCLSLAALLLRSMLEHAVRRDRVAPCAMAPLLESGWYTSRPAVAAIEGFDLDLVMECDCMPT